MKWRIVKVLIAVVLPAVLEALADGRVTRDEVEELLGALLEALGKLSVS